MHLDFVNGDKQSNLKYLSPYLNKFLKFWTLKRRVEKNFGGRGENLGGGQTRLGEQNQFFDDLI